MDSIMKMDLGEIWKHSGFGFGVDRFFGEWVWENYVENILKNDQCLEVDLSGLEGFTNSFIVEAFCGGNFSVERTLQLVTFSSPNTPWRDKNALETLEICYQRANC